jgi:hypothetical protein
MDKEEEEAAVCQGFLRFDQRTKTERASREAVRASRYKQYKRNASLTTRGSTLSA